MAKTSLIFLLLLTGLESTFATSKYVDRLPTFHSLTTFQTNMTILSGAGTSITAPLVPWKGAQSNLVTFGTGTVTFVGAISPPVNICNDSSIGLTVYFQTKTGIQKVSNAAFGIGNNLTQYLALSIQAYIQDTNYMDWTRWNSVAFPKRVFAKGGGGLSDCANVDTVFFQLTSSSATDSMVMGEVVSFSPVISKAIFIPTMDLGFDSLFRLGYPKMKQYNFPFTLYVNGGELPKGGSYISETRLDSIIRADTLVHVSNQMWTHDTMVTLTVDSMIRSISKNNSWIRSHNWPHAAPTLFAIPYALQRHDQDSALRACGLVDFTRITAGIALTAPQWFYAPYMQQSGMIATNSSSASSLTTILDSARAAKGLVLGIFHDVCTSCASPSITIKKAQWDSLWDYCALHTSDLTVMTMDQYLLLISKSLGGQRTRVRSRSR